MTYELIEPLAGPSIFRDFLDAHGDGVHHVAWDCNGIPMAERVRGFEARGYAMVQSGDWAGGNRFAFFENAVVAKGVWFETIVFGEGEFPAAEEVWPPPSLPSTVHAEGEEEGGKGS